jgi:hypothetical protein
MKRNDTTVLLVALFLVAAHTAFATTLYVNGVSGDDTNDCKSRTTACATIGHAISLSASGDSVMIAAAIYQENRTCNFSNKGDVNSTNPKLGQASILAKLLE